MGASEQRQFIPHPSELDSREAWLDPFRWYREMRRESPVRYDGDRGCWDVFGYDDVKRVLGDFEAFSSDMTQAATLDTSEFADTPIVDTVLRTDPPRHTRLRSVAEPEFRPKRLADLESEIASLTASRLDGLDETEPFDFVEEIAYPVPVIVIAELLGVPTDDRALFKSWSDTLVEDAPADGDVDAFIERQERTLDELESYFVDLIADRRENPRDDLISTVATATVGGETLTEREVRGFCMLLLVAGNITTTNLLTNAIRCFAERPSTFEELRDGEVTLEAAIEEVLRHRSPVQAVGRVAVEETTIGGRTVEPGSLVIAWVGSANRDEAVFEDPETFDPSRRPNQHLGFGHGIHFCLGAPLARLEARVILSQLLERCRAVEPVSTQLRPIRSSFLYGVESLPVRLA
ncbi:cytochrome P450 [Haloferacaceae archaeon DSL9]